MDSVVDIYKKYQAQTFPYPSLLEIEKAKGSYIFDNKNKKYLDFVAGVSATSVGHSNQKILNQLRLFLQSVYYSVLYLFSFQVHNLYC